MDADDIKYRRCQMPGCAYKEPRGSQQGLFLEGKFVCDGCFTKESGVPAKDARAIWDRLSSST